MRRPRLPYSSLLLLLLGGCATTGGSRSGSGSAAGTAAARSAECAAAPSPCTAGEARGECFETLPAVPYGGRVRVTNRLKAGSCPAAVYCQCVSVTVSGNRTCSQCRSIEFQRLLNGEGHWHTEVYELGPEVVEVVEVKQAAGSRAAGR